MFRRALLLAALMAFTLAGCGGGSGSHTPKVLRVAIGSEPISLDPPLATDSIALNVILNTGDPLVALDHDAEAVPSLAQSWDWSPNGKTITFHLRKDGRWTNGDQVTAHDFEWSWKRLLSPEIGSFYAYFLYGVVGGRAYNECTEACARLREKVGIAALDDFTLQVRLTSPQPWFPEQLAHGVFVAVHRATVERFGKAWPEPKNIVTNGPFKLRAWTHDKSIVLVKNATWRDAKRVSLDRVVLPVIGDPAALTRAFRRGAIDATLGDAPVPAEDVQPLTSSGDLATYSVLANFYYGFNLANVPDINQRRAMAFAIDRGEFVRRTDSRNLPGTGFIPPGMPGFDLITQDFLSPEPDLGKARAFMRRVPHPKLKITLYLNDLPDVVRSGEIAKEAWAKLGITTRTRVLEWAQYLEALGPPPRKDMDVARLGWIGDFTDAYNFFQLLGCRSDGNYWNFCDPAYDELLRRASQVEEERDRYRIYARLEARLTGPDGLLPVIPILWGEIASLEKPSVRGTFNINPLAYVDFAAVRPKT